MKPRIKPRPNCKLWKFECTGICRNGYWGWGGGDTPEEAYAMWLKEPLPF